MDCYNFCQQCEDYIATIKALKFSQILFATFFFWDRMSFCWQQYKQKRDTDSFVSVTWDKFKAFFRRSLDNS